MSFSALGLSPDLCRRVSDLGYTEPTPVQHQGIPRVLTGGDLLASAQTGTGKTAAFTLPMLQMLLAGHEARARRVPRALILTPTRELALQVTESFESYGRSLPLRTLAVFGGVGIGGQLSALKRGVDVVVATPGRLIDHLERRSVNLDHVEILVLDEADRMLDMGFRPALKKILRALPKKRQTLLFSATISDEIESLARDYTDRPERIAIAPEQTVAAGVRHEVHPVDHHAKRALLQRILADHDEQALVFCRTKRGSDRLSRQLDKAGFDVGAIHGNKSQNQRTRALNAFKAGRMQVLVATDVAARGLDIPQLPRVINFDLPNVAEDYVHRIGRTGRAGETGHALSLVCHDQAPLLRDIQKILDQDIAISPFAGFEPSAPLNLRAAAKRPSNGGGRGGGGRNGGGRGHKGGYGGGRRRNQRRSRVRS